MQKIFVIVALATLICNISFICAQEPSRQHVLARPYLGAGADIPFWNFGGHTVVSDEYVRLTPDRQSRSGWLWSKFPIRFANWEVIVEFKVHGQGKKLFGDGFAFWYAKTPNKGGPVFGSQDYFEGLGLFFDTYSNHNGHHHHAHPYVSAMVNDGTKHYDHDADGTHTEISGCEAQFRNKQYATRFKVSYNGDTLQVMVDIDNQGTFRECFSTPGIHLPLGYYIGFSAATGDVADNHDIINVQVNRFDVVGRARLPEPETRELRETVPPKPFAAREAPKRSHVNDEQSGFFTSIAYFAFIVIVLVGVALGIILFIQKKSMEKRNKRF